ncbi:MAG: hypothetical protein JW748_05860 [Anaerolineales bacterium]|nr:hypothetical protein [Anaerolineales bacterium]
MSPRYRYPAPVTLSILRDFLLGRNRSFAADAVRLSKGIQRLEVSGPIPDGPGPYLFLVNHFSRPGFQAWWIDIALGAACRRELHWPMTSAWTYPDALRARLITPLTERALARAARMYGFTLMPPMPPREEDVEARAASVRRILRLARRERPSIGMAPEGMDSPGGRLMQPPSGVGRFVGHLAGAGYTLIPAGLYETEDACRLRFGAAFTLPRKITADPEARDRETGKIVMEKIAGLLPERLTPPLSPPHNGEGEWVTPKGSGKEEG